MRRCHVLNVGNELLSGWTLNTNLGYLARALAEAGFLIERQVTVGDEVNAIAREVRDALGACDLLLVTGGLGPTDDDLTREGLSQALGLALVEREEARANLEEHLARRGVPLRKSHLKQVLAPEGARLFHNSRGSACGMLLEASDTLLFAAPGVPAELRAVVEEGLLPELGRRFGAVGLALLRLRTIGLPETEVAELVEGAGAAPAGVVVGFLPSWRGVDVTVTAAEADVAGVYAARLREVLGEYVYGEGDEALEAVVVRVFKERGLSLSLAESCTGGMVGSLVTAVPGASEVFLGGVVAYSNESKTALLGVPAEVIARSGAVSAECARAMALGAAARFGAQVAVAVTGIAGPSGGSGEKPVGTVFFGIASGDSAWTLKRRYGGRREEIRERAAAQALELIRRVALGMAVER